MVAETPKPSFFGPIGDAGKPLSRVAIATLIFMLAYPISFAVFRAILPEAAAKWIDATWSMVEFFASFMPAFDAASRTLMAMRMPDRVRLIQHVLAFNWAAAIICCGLLTYFIWDRRSRPALLGAQARLVANCRTAELAFCGGAAF